MAEFLLRYNKVPSSLYPGFDFSQSLYSDTEKEVVRSQAREMAKAIHAKLQELFSNEAFGYELRNFEEFCGLPDFYVTVWLNDPEDCLASQVNRASKSVLGIMKEIAYSDQGVGCKFYRVREKYYQENGTRNRQNRRIVPPKSA